MAPAAPYRVRSLTAATAESTGSGRPWRLEVGRGEAGPVLAAVARPVLGTVVSSFVSSFVSSVLVATLVPGAAPTAVAPSTVWRSPVTATVVLAPFQPPAQRWDSGNRGVDLAASPGDPVLSPSAGIVTFAGAVAGVPIVVVSGPGGWRSTLQPVQAGVAVGARVRRGQMVGTVAGAPVRCAPSTCLHWGVVSGRGHGVRYRDPMALLHPRAPVLLPW